MSIKCHSISCKGINVRRLYARCSEASQRPHILVVSHEENDIWTIISNSMSRIKKDDEKEYYSHRIISWSGNVDVAFL